MKRLWDLSRGEHLKTLPHWWLYGGKLVSCSDDDVRTDFILTQARPLRCALVAHHAMPANSDEWFLAKFMVTLGDESQSVIVMCLCSRACVDAVWREPRPLLSVAMKP